MKLHAAHAIYRMVLFQSTLNDP